MLLGVDLVVQELRSQLGSVVNLDLAHKWHRSGGLTPQHWFLMPSSHCEERTGAFFPLSSETRAPHLCTLMTHGGKPTPSFPLTVSSPLPSSGWAQGAETSRSSEPYGFLGHHWHNRHAPGSPWREAVTLAPCHQPASPPYIQNACSVAAHGTVATDMTDNTPNTYTSVQVNASSDLHPL